MKEAKVFYTTSDDVDLYWRTGFFAHDNFIFIDIEGEGHLIVNPLEVDRAKKEAKNISEVVNTWAYRKMKNNENMTIEEMLIMYLKDHHVTHIVLEKRFPAQTYEALRNHFSVIFQAKPLYPERLRKNNWEIEQIQNVQSKGELALGKVFHFLRTCIIKGKYIYDGNTQVTSELIQWMIRSELDRNNCSVPLGTIVASGDQSAEPHMRGGGPLIAHAPIIFDIFPRDNTTGFFGDMTRVGFKGEPSRAIEKMYRTVLAGQELGISMIKVGVDGALIYETVEKFFESEGYPTDMYASSPEGFIHSFGHGVGQEIHEPLRMGRRQGNKNDEDIKILEENNVITPEPGLYYKKIGGVRIEDIVVVKKEGCTNLNSFPKNFESMIL